MSNFKCFKDCQKNLFKPRFSDLFIMFFSDMEKMPFFKGTRPETTKTHNDIKCILQYLFWNTKGRNCIPCPCDICGKNQGILLGHIKSRDNGGTYNLQNLLWTCESCEKKIGPHDIQLKNVNKNSLSTKYKKISDFIEQYNRHFKKDKHISFNYNFGTTVLPVNLQKELLPTTEFKKRENERKILENFKQIENRDHFKSSSKKKTKKKTKKRNKSSLWSSTSNHEKNFKQNSSSVLDNWDD